MDSIISFGTAILAIFLAAIIGALPPFLRKWDTSQLHQFVALSAGVFLGAAFFHLVPAVIETQPGLQTELLLLLGFLAVLFAERVLVRHKDHDCDDPGRHRHEVVGLSALVGLSLHSLMTGIALTADFASSKPSIIVLVAILAHKSVAAFSLATVFVLSGISRKTAIKRLILFAAWTPIGALVALAVFGKVDQQYLVAPSALAAGSFIYVATMDLLPEAFHDYSKRVPTFISLGLGILMMLLISFLEGSH